MTGLERERPRDKYFSWVEVRSEDLSHGGTKVMGKKVDAKATVNRQDLRSVSVLYYCCNNLPQT